MLHIPVYSIDTSAYIALIIGRTRTANGCPKIPIPRNFDTTDIEQIGLIRVAPIFAVVTIRNGFVSGIRTTDGGPNGAVPLHIGPRTQHCGAYSSPIHTVDAVSERIGALSSGDPESQLRAPSDALPGHTKNIGTSSGPCIAVDTGSNRISSLSNSDPYFSIPYGIVGTC